MTGKGGEGSETNALYLARQNGRKGRRGSVQKAAPKCKWGSKLVEVATEEGRAMRGGGVTLKGCGRALGGSHLGFDSIGTIHE